MTRVCVYCGSRMGNRGEYRLAARQLGASIAANGLGLVYGGSRVGLMGVLADAALAGGAEVIGVIPAGWMERERAHPRLTELRVVDGMHARKATMAELGDAFVALPGGLGTLEEMVETLTWAQLGMHGKPCGLVSAAGYFDPLLGFLDHAVQEGFLPADNLQRLLVEADAPRLLERLMARLGEP